MTGRDTTVERFDSFLEAMAALPRWKQKLVYKALDRIVAGEPAADVQRWLADRFEKGEGKGRP